MAIYNQQSQQHRGWYQSKALIPITICPE